MRSDGVRRAVVVLSSTAVAALGMLSSPPANAAGTVTFRGVLRDGAGTGVDGASVEVDNSLGSGSTYTDANGAFSLAAPTGAGTLTVSYGNGQRNSVRLPPQWRVYTTVNLTTDTNEDLTLPASARLSVYVQQSDGSPAAGVQVFTSTQDPVASFDLFPGATATGWEQLSPPSSTGASGSTGFDLLPLPALSTLYAEKWTNGYPQIAKQSGVAVTADTTVTMTLPPAPIRFSGVLRDGAGAAVDGAYLEVDNSLGSGTAYSDANGAFSLTAPTGAATLTVSYGNGQRNSVRLPPQWGVQASVNFNTDTSQDLTLPATVVLSVGVSDDTGSSATPVPGAQVYTASPDPIASFELFPGATATGWEELSPPATSTSDGTASFNALPAPNIPTLDVDLSAAGSVRRAIVHSLDLTQDKTLPVVLGTEASPTTYAPPSEPTAVHVSASDASSVTVTYSPPASDGASTDSPSATTTTALVQSRFAQTRTAASATSTTTTNPSAYAVSEYTLLRGTDPATLAPIALLPGTQLSYTDKTVTPGVQYYYSVAARNIIGRGPPSGTVVATTIATSGPTPTPPGADVTAPKAVMTAPRTPVTLGTSTRVRWSGQDTGVGVSYYDVRYRTSDAGRNFTAWAYPRAWQRTSGTSATLRVKRGYEYCFSVRAHDRAANVSAWSAPKCTAVPLDDRVLAARQWHEVTGRAFYAGTAMQTRQRGATLTRSCTPSRQVALIVTRGRNFGSLAILYNGRLVKSLSLFSAHTRYMQVIRLPSMWRTTRLTLRSNGGRMVQVDGLLLARL